MGTTAESISRLLDVGDVAEWSGAGFDEAVSRLPLAARASFEIEGVSLLGEKMVCATPLQGMKHSALASHMDLMSESLGVPVVCVLEDMTPYLRRTLVDRGLAFVSGDGQAYVPGLLRLRRMRKAPVKPRRSSLSPAGRLVFIYLAGHVEEDVTVTDLALATGLSNASVKRAIDEVRAAAPLSKRMGGPKSRTAIYRVDESERFTAEGSASFGEAVRSRFLAGEGDASSLPLCGLSALAERSLLAPPRTPQVACSPSDAASLKGLAVGPGHEGRAVEVLALSYDPLPLAEDGLVDLCTMAMTVDRSDERVDSTIEEALEGRPWLLSIQ